MLTWAKVSSWENNSKQFRLTINSPHALMLNETVLWGRTEEPIYDTTKFKGS